LAEEEKDEFRKTETRQVVFNRMVPPMTGVVLQAACPLNGKITEICYHFAPGANQLVQVALRYGTTQISPLIGFISLDNATPVFYIDQPCSGKEYFFLTIQNTDILNPHTISCVITVIGEHGPPIEKE